MNDLYPDFPSALWTPFAERRPEVRCSPGHLIYLQDTRATCFYYLKEGRVKSFIQSADGTERTLNTYETGSLFGEAAFFDGLPRMSSAVALSPCRLVPIDRELVAQEFARDPGLALGMVKYLARTVRLLSAQVDQMAFRPARWRVARYLLARASQGSLTCPAADLARELGLSRASLYRAFRTLEAAGLIVRQGKTIRIPSLTALEGVL